MEFAPSPKARAWLTPLLDGLRPLAREAAALSFFINLLALAAPVFVLQVYDRVVFRSGLGTLAGLTIGMAIACSFDFVLRQARAQVMQRAALRIDVKVSRALFEKMMAVPLPYLENRPNAYWQLLFRDVDAVRNTLSGPTAMLLVDAPFALLFLGVVFVIAWPVAWVLILILGGFVALSWRASAAVGGATEKEKAAAVRRDGKLEEIIAARNTVKALGMGARMQELWEGHQADTMSQSIARGRYADTSSNIGQTLTVIATVAMTAVGAIAIINQSLTIGGLIAANMLAGRLLSPMNQLVGAWRTYTAFRQSADRLAETFALTEDVHTSAIALARPQGHLALDKVHFTYGAATALLEDVSVAFSPGGVTAIMGGNGSGKTTLVKLLLGLYHPSKGRALLDGADLAQFSRAELSAWIGYAPQDPVLLNASIRDNITYGRKDATDAEIVAAATMAQAHQAIVALPKGYATLVGEGGGKLSGGMRQRISIARALLGGPPVIVLDEPTSSLDRQAEEGLKTALGEIARDRTVIVVTHSPVLLQACRALVVMEAGRVVADGPVAAVMAALAKLRQSGGTGAALSVVS